MCPALSGALMQATAPHPIVRERVRVARRGLGVRRARHSTAPRTGGRGRRRRQTRSTVAGGDLVHTTATSDASGRQQWIWASCAIVRCAPKPVTAAAGGSGGEGGRGTGRGSQSREQMWTWYWWWW